MEKIFTAFAKFGNAKSDGKQITLSNSDKWMKEAGVIDGKQITTTDTAIEFKKFKAKSLDLKQFNEFIEALAKAKKLDPKQITEKLLKCAMPGTAGTTEAAKSAVVDRMTDETKYTGRHKRD